MSAQPMPPAPPKVHRSRTRHSYIIIGPILAIILHVLIDPQLGLIKSLPFGATTVVLLATLLKAFWFVAFLHGARIALLDYLNLETLFDNASLSPEGSGSAIIGVGLIMLAVAVSVAAAVLSN
jgi:hypothetical protein